MSGAATIVNALLSYTLLIACVIGGLVLAGVVRLDTWRARGPAPDATTPEASHKAKPRRPKPLKATLAREPEPAREPTPAPEPAKAKAAKKPKPPKAPTPAPAKSAPPPAVEDPELTACKAHVKEGSAHVERARAQLEAERRARELAAAAAANEDAEDEDEEKEDDEDDQDDDDDDDDDDDELDLSVVQSEGEWKSAKRAPKRPSLLDPKARAKAVAERKAAKAAQREVDATNLRNRKKREKKREKELAVRESLRQRVVVSSKY